MSGDADPRVDKIAFRGAIGLVVVVLLMIGFLADVPETRLWFYIAVPIGIVLAVIFRFRNP